MRLIAELTMPRNNAWNGKWTGKDNKYTILFSTSKNMCKYIGNYRYDFGDGWVANVEIREAEYREKITNEFLGYGWMVDSIKKFKEIRCR